MRSNSMGGGRVFLACLMLGALLSCSRITAPQLTQTSDPSHYFWKHDTTMRYVTRDSLANVSALQTITFRGTDDSLVDISDAQSKWFASKCSVSDSSVDVSGLGSNSFLPIPSHLSISSDSGYLRKATVLTLLGDEKGSIIAGTDSGGLFMFDATSMNWLADSLSGVNRIIALAREGTNVYAASQNGSSLLSSDGGLSWIRLTTTLPNISSVAVTNIAGIPGAFAIAGGRMYQVQGNTATVFQPAQSYTTTLLYYSSSGNGSLFIGTIDGQILEWDGITLSAQVLKGGITDPVTAIEASVRDVHVGTSSGLVYIRNQNMVLWNPLIRVTGTVTSLLSDLNTNSLLIAGSSGLTSYDITNGTTTTLLQIPVSQITRDQSGYMVLCGDGTIQYSANPSAPWLAADKGLSASATIRQDRPLTLLRGTLDVGAGWSAANVLDITSGSRHALRARVINHYDRYVSPIATFQNVLLVRYCRELNGMPDYSQLPYSWLVYYQKDVGPILIQEFYKQSLLRESSLSK